MLPTLQKEIIDRPFHGVATLVLSLILFMGASNICFSDNILIPQIDDTVHTYGNLDPTFEQMLPALASIVAKPALSRNPAGVYTWTDDWATGTNLPAEFNKIGWNVYRIGTSYNVMLTDDQASNLMYFCEDTGAEVMFGLLSHERNHFGVFGDIANDQLFFDNFNAFADSMIGNYGPGGSFWTRHPTVPYHPILFWEIYNEPNEHYLVGEPYDQLDYNGKADLYARLLLSAYAHIRANPKWDNVKLVGGSTSVGGLTYGGLKKSFDELLHIELAAHGDASQAYDIWSSHPYCKDVPPDTEIIVGSDYHYSLPNITAEIRRVMDSYGNQNKPIWWTEVGWHRNTGSFPASSAPYITERQQAAYVIRLYMMALRLGIEAVHVMMDLDADRFNGGFIKRTTPYTWYESAIAANIFISILPKPKIVEAISDGNNGYYSYRVVANTDKLNASKIIVAWNVKGPKTVRIPCDPARYTITDMIGNSIIYAANSSYIDIEIGPYPLYIGSPQINPPSGLRIKP